MHMQFLECNVQLADYGLSSAAELPCVLQGIS